MILFTILRGISAPCLYSFTPSGFRFLTLPYRRGSISFHPCLYSFHPFGVLLAHPAMSQGLHFIPPLPLSFLPLRGFHLCADTSLWKSRTPKGWQDHRQGCSAAKPLRNRHSHTILNPEGVTELSLSPLRCSFSILVYHTQGFLFIPLLPVTLSPLRGSPCASRFVTGVPFHSTPACGLFTPSGFPPMRQEKNGLYLCDEPLWWIWS